MTIRSRDRFLRFDRAAAARDKSAIGTPRRRVDRSPEVAVARDPETQPVGAAP
jgi:hypothetical protein